MPAKKAAVSDYVSNPFTVFINSFRSLGTNITTLLALLGLVLASFLAYFIVIIVAGLIAGDSEAAAPLVLVVLLIPGIVWVAVLSIAYTKYAIMTANQQTLSLRQALSIGWQKAAGMIGLGVLSGLIIIVGLVLLVIPGLVAIYWLLFAPYVYVDQEVSITEAMKRSRQLVKGKLAEIGGLLGANLIFGLPGWIPFIGSLYQLIYSPVSQIAMAYRYNSARQLDESKQAKPPTDPANYWAIAIAILVPATIVIFIAAGIFGAAMVEQT
jgi:hypothetical protein